MMGHKEIQSNIYPILLQAIENAVVFGVKEFIIGQYGAFDIMARKAVCEIKSIYGGITSTVLLPYYDYDSSMLLPEGVDGSFYPEGLERVPKRYAIVRANQYALHHSGYAIFYAIHPGGNATKLFEEAKRMEKKGKIVLVNLAGLEYARTLV